MPLLFSYGALQQDDVQQATASAKGALADA